MVVTKLSTLLSVGWGWGVCVFLLGAVVQYSLIQGL